MQSAKTTKSTKTASTLLTATTAYIKNPEQLEQLINVKNGLLDLTSMKLISRPLEFSSLPKLPKLDVSYDSTATCPVFDRFLDDVCDVNKSRIDADTAGIVETTDATVTADMAETASKADTVARKLFLLEFMGAIFSNVHADRFNKQVLFLYGPNDTGKTQIKRLVEEMLGYRNFSILNPHISSPAKQRKSIAGTRLTGSGDMSKTEFKCLVNALRNPDSLQKPETVLGSFDGFWWFNMNPKPDFNRLAAQSNTTPLTAEEKEQIAVFQFPNVIPVERRDSQILKKMLAERDGIFAKVISVFSAMKDFDFHDPAC